MCLEKLGQVSLILIQLLAVSGITFHEIEHLLLLLLFLFCGIQATLPIRKSFPSETSLQHKHTISLTRTFL